MKKTTSSTKQPSATVVPTPARCLSGKALIADMDAYRKEVSATPESARAFLQRLGVLTPDGTRRDLISD